LWGGGGVVLGSFFFFNEMIHSSPVYSGKKRIKQYNPVNTLD
jgi:hypothetical protein